MPRSSTDRLRNGTRGILPALFLLLSLTAPASGEAPGASEVPGRKLAALRGAAIDRLRAYAFVDGAPRPVPFQIDERDPKDRWTVVRDGRRLKEDPSPGILDENDVLVVMNRDLGPRGDLSLLPEAAEKWMEVRVGERDEPIGFAYVGRFEDPPARSDVDYARYDRQADRIVAEKYDVTFGAPLPTRLTFDGSSLNVLRAMRARGEARFFGGLFTIERTERAITAEIEGAVDGPVRVIRPARYRISLPLGFRANARVNLLFYRDFVVGQSTATIKIPPRLVPADGELAAYLELAPGVGSRLLLGEGDVSDEIGTGMTPVKRRLVGRKARWAGMILPDERTLIVAVRPEGALEKLDQRLYFQDRPAGASFGFELDGVNRLETGEHDLHVYVMLLGSDVPAEIERAAEMLRSPPEVEAAEVVVRGGAGQPAAASAVSSDSTAKSRSGEPPVR